MSVVEVIRTDDSDIMISNTLVNDTEEGVIAYAEQIKDNNINLNAYDEITNDDKTQFELENKIQSNLNSFLLHYCNEFKKLSKDINSGEFETIAAALNNLNDRVTAIETVLNNT